MDDEANSADEFGGEDSNTESSKCTLDLVSEFTRFLLLSE